MVVILAGHDKVKRTQVYWWQLGTWPKCPIHDRVCIVNGTKITEDGRKKIQARRCPIVGCDYRVKTVVAMK